MQNNLKGKIINTSWGYDMTHNDYAVVLDQTEKTILCQMLGNKQIDGAGFEGKEVPDVSKTIGSPFRLRIKGDESNTYFTGSYPFVISKNGESKHKGYFNIWSGQPNHYNYND